MNFEEIQALSLSTFGTLWETLRRMGVEYVAEDREADDWYARFSADPMPAREDIEAELVAYKAFLVAAETARLAEIARVAGLKSRWAAMLDIRGALVRLGRTDANPELLLISIIAQNDTTLMELLEAAHAEWTQERGVINQIDADAKRGRALQAVCDKVYHYILGFNRRRGLTSQRGDLMEMRFANALQSLKNGRADKAYALIQGIDIDGDLTTDEMKRNSLRILADAANI